MWRDSFDRFFIDDRWVIPDGTDYIDVVSPTTEESIARVSLGSEADVNRAVEAARRAFDAGPWSRTTLEERMSLLRRVAEGLAANQEKIAQLITEEMGCPISQSPLIQVANARGILEAFLDVAEGFDFQSSRSWGGRRALVVREPVGVVAAVIPWNVPLCIAVQKLTPALLAGCTFVLKPAPEAPLSSFWLAELLQEAGLPPGVFNIVPAQREVSEYLIAHPGVDKVAFTGSTAAGRRIAELCGNDLRRVTLELGGKSAAVVLDDADLPATVESLRLGSLRNSGQICSLKTRIIVPREREEEVLDQLIKLVNSMPVGDPRNPTTQIGPMVTQRQRERVESYIRLGREEGAVLVTGGGRPEGYDRGWFVEPTIFTGVQSSMRIAQEEIFGPVLSVLTYNDEEEAIRLANDSAYGLNGAVFTSDLDRGVKIARRIRTGTVELNGNGVGWLAPAGGFKFSGIGRENGPEGLDAYTEIKSIGLPL